MGDIQSSDSSNSTLTQSTDSAAKRKRDCESDCDSFVSVASERTRSFRSSLQPRFSSVRPLPMSMDLTLLFKQLVAARFSQYPYEEFNSWDNVELWRLIADNLKRQNGYACSSITVQQILDTVSKYYMHYLQDKLQQVEDKSLKHDMHTVFQHFVDVIGGLRGDHIQSVRDTILLESNSVLNDSTTPIPVSYGYPVSPGYSNEVLVGYSEDHTGLHNLMKKAYKKEKLINVVTDHSDTGFLTTQLHSDLQLFGFSGAERAAFLFKYGPESTQYMYALLEDKETKRIILRKMVDQAMHEYNHPASSSSSCKRSRGKQ